MSDDGRWVSLPDGAMPREGRRVRAVIAGVNEETRWCAVRIKPGCSPEDIVGVPWERVPVEVWEPAESLVVGEWYRDVRGDIARRHLDADYGPGWWAPYFGYQADSVMVRPLRIARWEPVP